MWFLWECVIWLWGWLLVEVLPELLEEGVFVQVGELIVVVVGREQVMHLAS